MRRVGADERMQSEKRDEGCVKLHGWIVDVPWNPYPVEWCVEVWAHQRKLNWEHKEIEPS